MKTLAVLLSALLSWGLVGPESALPLGSSGRLIPIEGIVRELSGEGIPSARVELWSDARLLAATRTDVSGAFRLEIEEPWSPRWRLEVSRLGYGPASVPVSSEGSAAEVLLTPAPLPLPGFEVEGQRDFCAAPESREARALWEAARTRHAGGLDTLGIASYTHLRTDTIPTASEAGMGLFGAEPGQRASAPLLRLSWDRRVERDGYAFRVRRSDRERSYDSWSYPPLEADFAPHFAEETFGRLHAFHLEFEDAGGWVLRFCGTRTNRPYLEGSVEIGPDTLIRQVEWRFRTPEPDETAGGWAKFAPPPGDEGFAPLLPTESMTWRSLPEGDVLRRAQWYEGWIMAPGDSVPFLPLRSEDRSGTP
jgi:hypothetical protein